MQKSLQLLVWSHLHLPSLCVTVSEEKSKAMVVSPKYFQVSVYPHFSEGQDQSVSMDNCHSYPVSSWKPSNSSRCSARVASKSR